jgi:hypothetical protein
MSSNDATLATNHLTINHLNHDQIREWLSLALQGQKTLPRLTPDESHHLGIMRLEQAQEPATRRSINGACNELLRQFVEQEQAQAQGETVYAEELLLLASKLKAPESIARLSALAQRPDQFSGFALAIRHLILAILADASPPQSIQFWRKMLQQDRINYAGMALAGALAVDPMQAVQLLPDMPDEEDSGEYAALNIDLAWDDLPHGRRGHFEVAIEAILTRCPQHIAAPLGQWLASKNPVAAASQPLADSLVEILRLRVPDDFQQPTRHSRQSSTLANQPRPNAIWCESLSHH